MSGIGRNVTTDTTFDWSQWFFFRCGFFLSFSVCCQLDRPSVYSNIFALELVVH